MSREEISLKEYEVCQQHNNTIGTQAWQATSIFLLVNLGIVTFVFQRGTHNRDSFALVLVIGIIFILISYFWRRWVKRRGFVTKINYQRMREIEEELGLWKNRYVHLLRELKNKQSSVSTLSSLSRKDMEHIKRLGESYPYAGPGGFFILRLIPMLIMIAWGLLIVREANFIFSFPWIGQWFLK